MVYWFHVGLRKQFRNFPLYTCAPFTVRMWIIIKVSSNQGASQGVSRPGSSPLQLGGQTENIDGHG